MIPCIDLKHMEAYKNRECYVDSIKALLQLIPIGHVTTYKDLAQTLNLSPRAVGNLLKLNDEPIVVPCHRIIKSNGHIGGYTLRGRQNPDFKKALLLLEGVKLKGDKVPKSSFYDLAHKILSAPHTSLISH